jgi:hypothetical protein
MKMKSAWSLALLIPSLALADTFTGLERPAPPPARWICAATGFSGLRVTGICQLAVPGRAKYEQPARYLYNVTWDPTGAVTQGALYCYSPAHMGIDHSGCPTMVNFSDTHTVVVIDGVPYWLVSSNLYGAQAVNTQTDALVWHP